jgi:glycosyltransferase involved in cell wall biosynthesis
MVHELNLQSSVRFLGQQLAFVEVLRAADAFLLPSETESFGLAALEALACGVPVVASRVGGLGEVIKDGESGFLVEKGDVTKMAEAVLRIVSDRALHARMAEAAREDAVARFRPEPILRRWEEVYAATISPKSSASNRRAPS